MTSKKTGAPKAAPKKAPREKPGPSARRKAREAQLADSAASAIKLGAKVGGHDLRAAYEESSRAQARLDNARAEEVELQNLQRRREMGLPDVQPKQTFADTNWAGYAQVVQRRIDEFSNAERTTQAQALAEGAQEARRNTVADALDANFGCLCHTDDLVDRLEKVLTPLLRPIEAMATDEAKAPAPVESELASRVRSHTRRNAEVNARLMALLDRIDLPN